MEGRVKVLEKYQATYKIGLGVSKLCGRVKNPEGMQKATTERRESHETI